MVMTVTKTMNGDDDEDEDEHDDGVNMKMTTMRLKIVMSSRNDERCQNDEGDMLMKTINGGDDEERRRQRCNIHREHVRDTLQEHAHD